MKIKTATLLLIATFSLFGGLIVALISYNLSNSYKIESTWFSFQNSQWHKGRALSALYSEIGYGGMIHNFKNYLLRRNSVHADATKSSIGGARAAITLYRALGLSKEEQDALEKIELNLAAYESALARISALIKNNKSAKEIDQLVKVDDRSAVNGLSTLVAHNITHRHHSITKQRRCDMIRVIRRAMGFGGMIHHFKNTILRGDRNAVLQAKQDLKVAQQAAQTYLSFDLSPAELNAITKMQNVFSVYESKIDELENIDIKKVTPESIDHLVQVVDAPALEGLATLDKEIVLRSQQAEEKLSQTLGVIIGSGKITLALSVLTFILFVMGAYWLIRLQIIKPISHLTHTMTRVANNEGGVKIFGADQNNEMGEMARAVEVFQENSLSLATVKDELSAANSDLESKVLRRTEALKNSEECLRSILETAVDAIIIIDGAGNIVSFNRAAENMFGYSQEEAIGKELGMLMPVSFRQRHDAYIRKYQVTGEAKAIGETREMEACRKNGEVFPIQISISELVSTEGVLFTGIVRDITELKAYQEKLKISKEAADRANNAKSDFVAGMNHELRTPMNAIMGFSQLLESNPDEPLSEAQKEDVAEIKTAGRHLLDIINQILELNKIEAGKMPIALAQTAPAKLVQESLVLVIQHAVESDIELIDNVEYETLPDLSMDAIRFKQVLINLLSNAIKYNKPGGSVILDATVEPDKVHFSVTDTGKGISQSRQSQIFVPFERLGHERGDIEGTGIGLSITKNIVELMGSKIGFESEEGEGSCFSFELPIYKAEK